MISSLNEIKSDGRRNALDCTRFPGVGRVLESGERVVCIDVPEAPRPEVQCRWVRKRACEYGVWVRRNPVQFVVKLVGFVFTLVGLVYLLIQIDKYFRGGQDSAKPSVYTKFA
uniref:Uncharacterized protein n=1 Tax=Ditylenchus dipsaci TaxID=166011 RepID=A0A915DVM0_9BILA